MLHIEPTQILLSLLAGSTHHITRRAQRKKERSVIVNKAARQIPVRQTSFEKVFVA